MHRRTRGFTFIELLIAMTVVGILSAVAVPKYIDLRRRANTTRVIGDFNAVRLAALNFFADSTYFPADASAGVVPQALRSYLPIGFTFQRAEWTLKYDNWQLDSGDEFSSSNNLIAVTVIPVDPQLGETTSRVLGNVPQVNYPNSYTFIISGM